MKLIGVMGNGGSGKTTFANYLDNKTNVGVIHVDELVGEVKKKYFKPFLQPRENNTTETTKANPKLNVKVKEFFYRNKFAFKFLMAVRSNLVKKELNQRINEFKMDRKKVIIIDDWALTTHKELLPKLNKIYVLQRSFLDRRRGLEERDELTKKELRVADLPYASGYIDIPAQDRVSIIKNNGSFEALFEKAEEEYESLGEQTFDERYSLKGKPNVKIAAEKLRKARQISGENKENRQLD